MNMIEVELVPMPLWVSVAQVEQLFGISAESLRRIAKEGVIRYAKLSDAKSAPRVYNVRDLNEWLAMRADQTTSRREPPQCLSPGASSPSSQERPL